MAGEAGVNCELTDPGQTIVRHDVKIVALNLPALMPEHASQLFARNVLALIELLVGEDGALKLDFERDHRRRLHRARRRDRGPREGGGGGGVILGSVLTTNLAILVLAGFVGFVVISEVPNTLHTP